ncbi:GDSL-type esterase/lipase family protein [Aporhodopirellula aestuarii]|uniref:GDSL-type esterase/lipase family protein n=1 Tax=Aporhodopirellula aestuarii TaxID=2950107 RepID=A0ABT0U2I2_9BACT|nr:GDSL-type esterase/lipase family protein [Aporhodopirellula aestuarii]MCM2371016.1 GDSL-type esterase/lipase family protein [Aporhodopirellula aestuarii]
MKLFFVELNVSKLSARPPFYPAFRRLWASLRVRPSSPRRAFGVVGALAAIAAAVIFGSPAAFAQQTAAPASENAIETQQPTLVDSPLNATEEELDGILSPKDRIKAIRRWDADITRFEKLDQTEPDPENAILLLGSSSIRLWTDAAEMLAPYPIIRRGYGGARHSDFVVFARRLISPHQYRAMVLFVANDITGSSEDRSVDEVRKMVMHVIGVSRKYQPDAPILLIEVTPTPSRWKVWPEIRSLNAMFREVALTEPNVFCLNTAEYYLNADDTPRPELFRGDKLHQNEEGYRIWADLIRRRLDEILSEETVQAKSVRAS